MGNQRYKILVLLPLNTKQQAFLCGVSPKLAFDFKPDCLPSPAQLREADIIIGNPPPALLHHAENLKWLQLITAGADAYLGQGVLKSSVLLTTASGAYGEAQSEFILSVLLSLFKKLHLYRDNQNQCLWRDEGDERMLNNSTALIIGLGDIGANFARRLKAFGTYVIGVRKTNMHPCEYADELYGIERLDALIGRADIISLTLPATSQTRHILNDRSFSLMRNDAVLLNTGRGVTVDTEALCRALQEKRIAGAALDVMEEEPLPPGHPLWKMRNVIITPHIAGHDFLPHSFEKTLAIISGNLKAYMEGKPLKNLIRK